MNILILTTHLNPGGISRYVVNLAMGLSQIGHKVYVASKGGEWKEKMRLTNVDFFYIPINTKSWISRKTFLSFFKLLFFVLHNRIQVICANTRVTQFVAYLLWKFTGIPYVSVFHGFYKKRWERRVFKFEGLKTIAVSHAVRNHLVRDFKISPDKISVVYNGIDKEAFKSLINRKVKTQFGLNKNDIVIGVLGRISQEKGHFLVVEAFKKLSREFENIYLFICGKGKLEKELKDFVNSLNLSDRVKFLDLEGEEFLDIVDILVVASSHEGFGFIILEAFAKKVCVIAYPTGGIKEIVKDGVNGLLFYHYSPDCLAENIKKIITFPELREKLTRNAEFYLDYFSLEKMVKYTEKIFEEVLNR